jgi:ABC-2 type transport system permease protein
LGLLLGGTLRAEIVLAVANLLWFVFAAFGALTVEPEGDVVPSAAAWVARLTPSGALTQALSHAMTLSVDWFGVIVLMVWGLLGGLCALRWFRFT